jgi:hypothetical protein
MKDEIHPLTQPALYARAEAAALKALEEAYAANVDPKHHMKLMDKAGEAVFLAGGVSRELADFFAACITADVSERESRP